MFRSIPIWIADSPDYTQGQEAWDEAEFGRARDEKGEGAKRGKAVAASEADGGRRGLGGDALRALRDQIEDVGGSRESLPRVVLGEGGRGVGIRFGAVHEMIQVEASGEASGGMWGEGGEEAKGARGGRGESRKRYWTPPLTLLAGVACEAMRTGAATRMVWIGRRVFPYPVFLARQHPAWLAASLFVDVRERDARVWAIDVALRSGVPTCVVADGQGLTLAESRRLQVAAKCGRGVALVARPAHEAAELSAAATRWMVRPWVGMGMNRAADGGRDVAGRVAWTLTLVRSKGESACMDAGSLIAEWRDAQGFVVVPAMVASRAGRKAADAAS